MSSTNVMEQQHDADSELWNPTTTTTTTAAAAVTSMEDEDDDEDDELIDRELSGHDSEPEEEEEEEVVMVVKSWAEEAEEAEEEEGGDSVRLSWATGHEHQVQLLDYFESVFRNERMVDVTLACHDASVRAHRVVLSASSGYLERLLADNPCSHPLLILDDVKGWQLDALISFMYRGEVRLPHRDIPSLIKVAESLQIRGLTRLDSISLAPSPASPASTAVGAATPAKMARYANAFLGGTFPSEAHTSPLPRRKQARPRRRSGDSSSATPPMDLCRMTSSTSSTPSPIQDTPEDLSVKKSPAMERHDTEETNQDNTSVKAESVHSVHSVHSIHSIHSDSVKSEFSVADRNHLFSPGPSGPTATPPTPPTPIPLTPNHQMDRRKGQHSAPRGGPPRAWTNADLTEALHHVWNRKMTTSQASRVFGIPYNSLLMYVRGKYGKSLKLDTLRKETLEGEAMALAASTRGSYKLAAAAAAAAAAGKTAPNNNNNNNTSNKNNNEPKPSSGKTQHAVHPQLPVTYPADAAHALATLGGFQSAMNPYLSYFCDFSFPPMSHAMMAALPPPPRSKTSVAPPPPKTSSPPPANVKEDSITEEEGPSPSPPAVNLRLAHALISPLDLPQPGQV